MGTTNMNRHPRKLWLGATSALFAVGMMALSTSSVAGARETRTSATSGTILKTGIIKYGAELDATSGMQLDGGAYQGETWDRPSLDMVYGTMLQFTKTGAVPELAVKWKFPDQYTINL